MENPVPYDVTLAVPSHGIHNPVNFHSCRGHPCYLPSECAVCKYVIFPLTAAATCMRCAQTFHRECVKDISSVCSAFVSTGTGTRAVAGSGAGAGDALWATDEAEDCDHLVKGAQPNWSDILISVSTTFKITPVQMADKTHLKMHDLVLTLLEDSSQFPAGVSAAVRRVYLKHVYKNDHNAVVQGRLALDQISSSIFCVLPAEVASDYDEMKSIINLTDRYTLSKNDDSMYEKIMTSATAIANKSDEALFHHLNKGYSEPVDDSICGHVVTDAFFKVLTAVTAMDKLTALSHALRVCVAEDVSVPPGTHRVASADRLQDTKPGAEPRRRNSKGKAPELTTPHGADALIERLIAVICFLSKRYKLRWHAQCTFIELMCPDTSWLFGAEGYSLVTLQQVLNSLLPTPDQEPLASTSSHGGSSHGGSVHGPAAAAVGTISSLKSQQHLDVLRSASMDHTHLDPGTE
jgi:hypothetical protein